MGGKAESMTISVAIGGALRLLADLLLETFREPLLDHALVIQVAVPGDTLDAAIILSRGPERGLHAVRLDHNMVHAICSKEMAETLGDTVDPDRLAKQTFLIHNELPASFEAWKQALGLSEFDPAAIDHYDSWQLMLAAAAQGLGIAIMHDDHLRRAEDNRLTNLYGVEVESPYSYWFVCKPTALESRPVRLFHDWLVSANL